MNKIVVRPNEVLHELGDLYGIFFEDLNHAADGGLHAEMVRNRSFEFDKIDNWNYTPLTAWEKVGNGDFEIEVKSEYPLNRNNTHYLEMDIKEGLCGVKNAGYNKGMCVKKGEKYIFSFYARRTRGFYEEVKIFLSEKKTGENVGETTFKIKSAEWEKYEAEIAAEKDALCELVLMTQGVGKVCIDMVSLFPILTFKGRKNGMRRDIAQMLCDLKPKFMRFPGGCLVHDGDLDPHSRKSLYRWKNTLGDVAERGARKSNWGYNQSLGIGYYEYFLFCEDIGAKPLPVLPAGYNPHRNDAVPIEELQPWIDDALDLIEFANGDVDTKYGAIRAKMGHEKPFGLEYLAIGNEEVGDAFFERYPYFHKAIKEKHPEIKLIGTAGPFPAGGEFEKGWKSARENGADLVDEHYYVAPEWLIANCGRYFKYDKNDPKVFLGEFASHGNTLYNALSEGCYMTAAEKSGNVALCCYAPLLANVDYVNWRPDMIWFDSEKVYGTPNYYVQKLFMNYQGDREVQSEVTSEKTALDLMETDIRGKIELTSVDTKVRYDEIKINGEAAHFEDLSENEKNVKLSLKEEYGDFELSVKATELEGYRGFMIKFGIGEGIYYRWEIGGWQNQDSIVCSHIKENESVLAHELRSVEKMREYELKLCVKGGRYSCFIDGEKVHEGEILPVKAEPIYVASSVTDDGKLIIKAVNVTGDDFEAEIETGRAIKSAAAFAVEGEPQDENSFENPEKISIKEKRVSFEGTKITHNFAKYSACVIVAE